MKDKNRNIESAITDYFLETEYNNIKEFLSEEVSNKELYDTNKSKHLRKIMFLSKAISNKIKDENLLNVVLDKFQFAINKNSDKHLEFINQVVYGNGVRTFYRSLDQLSREEISEMIRDKNLVEILEKLETEDENF